jgi:hypothetical protein
VIRLHDRLIPGTRGNIDHVFVAPSRVGRRCEGVQGKARKAEVGPIWRRDNEVFVAAETAPPLREVSRSKWLR